MIFLLLFSLNAYADVTPEQIEKFKKFALPHVCAIHPAVFHVEHPKPKVRECEKGVCK